MQFLIREIQSAFFAIDWTATLLNHRHILQRRTDIMSDRTNELAVRA